LLADANAVAHCGQLADAQRQQSLVIWNCASAPSGMMSSVLNRDVDLATYNDNVNQLLSCSTRATAEALAHAASRSFQRAGQGARPCLVWSINEDGTASSSGEENLS
jgi:hypothetical protein